MCDVALESMSSDLDRHKTLLLLFCLHLDLLLVDRYSFPGAVPIDLTRTSPGRNICVPGDNVVE